MPAHLPADLIPTSDLRPLPGADPAHPDGLEALALSVKAFGVLEPLLVRPAANAFTIEYGRRAGKFGYLVVDARLVHGQAYQGPPPAFFPTKEEALAAVPADTPFEVCRGLGRLAAARLCHLRLVPVVIRELTDDQVRALRGLA